MNSISCATGGTNGMGLETVRVLAKRGAHVFLAARNLSAADRVKEDIRKEIPSARIELLKLDLASLEAVRIAAQEFLELNVPLNVLVNNAGIFAHRSLKLSPDDIELTFATITLVADSSTDLMLPSHVFDTGFVGPFLFTHLLLDNKMKETAKESGIEGRIVNVSSKGHTTWSYKEGIRFHNLNDQEGYNMLKCYGQSKLAQILYTKELAKRLQEEGASVTVNAVHPGDVLTNIITGVPLWIQALVRTYLLFFSVTISQGAATQTYVAIKPDVKGVTGKYFDNVNETPLKDKHALDEELQKNLWDLSMKLVSA